ncbi:Saccharopine dehydrogenase-domain-containing protein [Blastocladiella britannica]|nr:Saccharopine dehydrogenase-domain-containing protein [Blastocladiella britannica]
MLSSAAWATSSTVSKAAWRRTFTSARTLLAPTIAIRRETKHRWERRAPLLPTHVSKLKAQGIDVLVQPSTIRVVGDDAYVRAGATVTDDLSAADVVLGIKEVEPHNLVANKTYVYFSHTHKGQAYNMGMLRDVLDKKVRLLDYELITDDKGKRTVMFGTFAGYAGMVDGLHSLGLRMLGMGYGSPFLNVGMAHSYPTLDHAKRTLRDIGEVISRDGLARAFGPLVVTFTGTGNVSGGARDVFECLPHEYVKPSDLPALMKSWDPRKVYGVVVDVQDHVVRTDGGQFAFDHYVKHPEVYKSEFATKIAPYTTMLVTGHYWDTQYPRLITKEQAKEHWHDWEKAKRMVTIADISCDIGGAIEFMSHAAKIDDPWFIYDPVSGKEHKDITGRGTQIMSVDILPAELPLESSQYFGDKLLPILADLAHGKTDKAVLQRATIAADGKLLPRHAWLEPKLPAPGSVASSAPTAALPRKRIVVLGSGFVAGPLVEYLLRRDEFDVTIASNNLAEAEALASATRSPSRVTVTSASVHPSHVPADLAAVLDTADVVVSLVPAALHLPVAEACIAKGTPMVTASYISDGMRALDKAARDAGVVIMNEVGLDPGIDHLTAKQFVDDVRANGGQVEGFTSWCGGLPAPEDSGNALGYKFSWSPRGVLLAAMNSAVYMKDGQKVHIPSEKLLTSALNVDLYKGYALEGIANRDSLAYIDQYELDRAHLKTMFRGTLRYKGYARLVHNLRLLGMLGTSAVAGVESTSAVTDTMTWAQWMQRLLGSNSDSPAALASAAAAALKTVGVPAAEIDETVAALTEFDMLSSTRPAFPAGSVAAAAPHPVALDATCARLQQALVYTEGERDMVAMHHEFDIRTRGGKRERHTATLVTYGAPIGTPGGATAMATTVGLPAAIATEMVLDGKIKDAGVLAPMKRDVYEPMLGVLTREGITFVERSRAI